MHFRNIIFAFLSVALCQGSGDDSEDYTYTYDSVDADAAEKSDGYNNGYNSGYNFNQASYSSDPYNQGYYGRSSKYSYKLSRKMKLILLHYLTSSRHQQVRENNKNLG